MQDERTSSATRATQGLPAGAPGSKSNSAAALILALGLAFAGSAAFASDGFEEGSFGDAATPAPAQGTAPGNDDGFGGSFGDGAVAPPKQQPEQAEAARPAPDDGFIDEGNIENPRDVGKPKEPVHVTPPESEIVVRPPEGNPPPPPPDEPATPGIDPGILAYETRDYGVPPTDRLRASAFHAPTPTSIPGGQLVTTGQLAAAMQNGQQMLIIDVLGSDYTLPNALSAPAMATPGNYRDRIQQQTGNWLGQITGNNPQVPIIVACSDPFCWLSYNAGLRAIAAGYRNVYWYRGGHQAWKLAGLPLASSGF